MVGHLAENGLIIGDEFREGNVSPSKRNQAFLKHCVKQMPKGKRVKALRSDSAGYQADIINYCEANDMEFGIGADLDKAVLGTIKAIAKEEWRPYKGGYIAETVHSMNHGLFYKKQDLIKEKAYKSMKAGGNLSDIPAG